MCRLCFSRTSRLLVALAWADTVRMRPSRRSQSCRFSSSRARVREYLALELGASQGAEVDKERIFDDFGEEAEKERRLILILPSMAVQQLAELLQHSLNP